MDVDPRTLSPKEAYQLLITLVVPRPIAWVSTLDGEGRANLLATGEGVVHICHRPLGEAMVATAASLAPSEDEFEVEITPTV